MLLLLCFDLGWGLGLELDLGCGLVFGVGLLDDKTTKDKMKNNEMNTVCVITGSISILSNEKPNCQTLINIKIFSRRKVR
jgi:hypothetical protein